MRPATPSNASVLVRSRIVQPAQKEGFVSKNGESNGIGPRASGSEDFEGHRDGPKGNPQRWRSDRNETPDRCHNAVYDKCGSARQPFSNRLGALRVRQLSGERLRHLEVTEAGRSGMFPLLRCRWVPMLFLRAQNGEWLYGSRHLMNSHFWHSSLF